MYNLAKWAKLIIYIKIFNKKVIKKQLKLYNKNMQQNYKKYLIIWIQIKMDLYLLKKLIYHKYQMKYY